MEAEQTTFEKNIFDDVNNHIGKEPSTIHEVTVLLSCINRNNPNEVFFDKTITLYFYRESMYIGGQDKTAYYEHPSINYWVRSRALSYFTYLRYDTKPDDVLEFIDKTKNKSWCFDSVVLNTTELSWNEYINKLHESHSLSPHSS